MYTEPTWQQKLVYIQQLDPHAAVLTALGGPGYILDSIIRIKDERTGRITEINAVGATPELAVMEWWIRAISELDLYQAILFGDQTYTFDTDKWKKTTVTYDDFDAELALKVDRGMRAIERSSRLVSPEREEHRKALKEEWDKLLPPSHPRPKRPNHAYANGFVIGGIGAAIFEIWRGFRKRNID